MLTSKLSIADENITSLAEVVVVVVVVVVIWCKNIVSFTYTTRSSADADNPARRV